jgi:hypothetical protein
MQVFYLSSRMSCATFMNTQRRRGLLAKRPRFPEENVAFANIEAIGQLPRCQILSRLTGLIIEGWRHRLNGDGRWHRFG